MDSLANFTTIDLALSKNPIVLNTDPLSPTEYPTRSGLRYLLDIYLPKYFQGQDYQLLTTLEASEEPPASTADATIYAGAYFDVADLLHSQLMAYPPDFGQQGISVCDTLTTSYYAVSRRLDAEAPIDTTQLPTGYVYRAGVGPSHYADFKDTFFSRYTQGRKFLTYKPNRSNIRTDQPEYLTYLTNINPAPTELRVRVNVLYADHTRHTLTASTLAGAQAMTAYCIPVGMQALGLLALPQEVLHYDLWISNEANERLSEIRTYYVDRTYHRQVRYVLFENSLGSFDTLALTGDATETLKVTRELADQFTGYDYLPTAQERIINRVSGERELSVAFGFPRYQVQAQKAWWQELYFSEQCYLITDRAHIALQPVSDSYLVQADAEDLVARGMVFRYTNQERSYSLLPSIEAAPTRATGWRGDAPACQINPANGLRTGQKRFGVLAKYYLDTGQDVKPYTQKTNSPGTEGYIDSWVSADCTAANTPYLSAAVSALSTFFKTGCAVGQVGTRWLISIPAGAYGSETSQADADARAQAAYTALDTQANANLYGSCIAAAPVPIGLQNNCPGDASGLHAGSYNPIAAVLLSGVEIIPNTTYALGVTRYAASPIDDGTYNIDVRAIFSSPPTLPYRIRIPSKSLASPTLNGPQTYRFSNVAVAWADPDLIIIIEPAP